jgi:hypothetical protein
MGVDVFTNCSTLTIKCQMEEQPSTWDSSWNTSSCPVIWGYGFEKGITTEGIKWISLDEGTARVVGYEGSETDLTIPTTINGKTVNRISNGAFSNNTSIINVFIPNTVVMIEENAFANMSNLQIVEISQGVTTMQANIFSGSSNVSLLCEYASKPLGWNDSWNSSNRPVAWNYAGSKGITSEGFKWALVGGNVTIVGYSGSNTNLTIPKIIYGNNVVGISENAFRNNTQITSIYIPSEIETIGDYAFSGCTNLTIYCERISMPSGWSSNWKDSSTTVHWSV